MEIQKQPQGSKTCGQHCIAMIMGKPAAYIIAVTAELCGKRTFKVGTRTKDMVTTLKHLGYTPASKLQRYKHQRELPSTCILSVTYLRDEIQNDEEVAVLKRHWVVYHEGHIYCPGDMGKQLYCRQTFIDFDIQSKYFLKIQSTDNK